MDKRIEINEEDLPNVTGGNITYTWDGTQGSLGMNGTNPYTLVDKDAFVKTYNELKDTKSDAEIIRALREAGIIRKP